MSQKLCLFALFICLFSSQALSKNPSQHWNTLGQKTKVRTPAGYSLEKKVQSFVTGPYTYMLHSRSFAQGEAGYLEVLPNKDTSLPFERLMENYQPEVIFQKRKIKLKRYSWGWGGLFAIHPDSKPGIQSLSIGYIGPDGIKSSSREQLKIKKTTFPIRNIRIDESAYASKGKKEKRKLDAFIQECLAKKRAAFKRNSANYLHASLAHPRDFHKVTSAYWTKRTYKYFRIINGKREQTRQKVRRHKGLDLKGKTGAPVFAMGRGHVALARKMHFEGGFIIIDHGNRVFTAYMHLEDINVKEGQLVTAGDSIATVGATGYVTGPHLDVSLYIDAIAVEPTSLLSLPIRFN